MWQKCICIGDLGSSSIALFALLHGLSAIQIVLHNNNTIHGATMVSTLDAARTVSRRKYPMRRRRRMYCPHSKFCLKLDLFLKALF